MSNYKITFITPVFSRGALETPEVRASSIRGQLRWWFRSLGGTHVDEKAIFGGVHGNAAASKIVVRVSSVVGNTDKVNTLPHKSGGQASPKSAFLPATSFKMSVFRRYGGLSADLDAQFERAFKAWLLLGTLGLRSTRAAGSFMWEALSDDAISMPTTISEYESACYAVVADAPLKVVVAAKKFDSAEELRRIVSDTLGGRNDSEGQSDLSRLRDPLGRAFRGRKTSPLRFRIVSPGNDEFYLAAVWDNRQEVTGNRPGDLEGIVGLLQQRKPRLGDLLIGL